MIAPLTTLRLGPPAETADGVVVLIHGRGQSAGFMQDAALRLGLPRLHYVLPEAPGNTWYPQSFLRPLAENEPALSDSIAALDALLAGVVAEGVAAHRILLGGFSQGACMTAELLVRRPRRLAGAIVWTGGLIGPPGTSWPMAPMLASMAMLVTGSDVDPFVPEARCHETARHFAACGCAGETLVLPGRAHEIADAEIDAARTLLARLIPPR